jgi:FKBP-type peptidyl-prolyl cis-trans isomerase
MAVHVDNTDDLSRSPAVSVTPDTLPNDLDITDLVVGQGQEAGPRDTVQVQYQGVRVSDGGEFDSSWGRGGTPVEFPLGQVIDGFKLGISGMREGGRRVLVVPPHQGYGAQGVPPVIPANAHLVFVVDLVKVN